jgi:hypothetical protein
MSDRRHYRRARQPLLRHPPEAATFAFFRDVVGCLPRDGFVLSDVDLDVWTDVEGRDVEAWPRCRREPPGAPEATA